MSDSGGHTEVVNASHERIIAALIDIESYPKWQSGVSEATVLERDEHGRGSLIEIVIDAKIRKVGIVLRTNYDDPLRMRSEFVRGDVAYYEGQYTIVPIDDRVTQVTLDIKFDLGFYMPKMMQKLLTGQSLKTTLHELKAYTETDSAHPR